jgi:hypothetical protein
MVNTPKLRQGTRLREQVKRAILELLADDEPRTKAMIATELYNRHQYAKPTTYKYLGEAVDVDQWVKYELQNLEPMFRLSEQGRSHLRFENFNENLASFFLNERKAGDLIPILERVHRIKMAHPHAELEALQLKYGTESGSTWVLPVGDWEKGRDEG